MTGVNRREFLGTSALGLSLLATRLETQAWPLAVAPEHRIYAKLMDPREHPDYTRHYVRPPDWDTFGNRTHFATLRAFSIEDTQITSCEGGKIVDYVEMIDKYTREYDLGDVLWLAAPILFAKNLGDLLDEIKKRNLFVFDIWSYAPGFGADGFCELSQPPYDAYRLLERRLGDHFLGMDNGENDGHYIGEYAEQNYPASAGHVQQYLNFQNHFELFGDLAGNKLSTLVSLGFGHYFLKEGIYALIGAETGQALPNAQIFYALNRGAGKQYGVPWFGNASVWNRWGWKTYGWSGPGGGGPTKGTSLSLLKRLMYSQILYNCMIVGFDQQWLNDERAGYQLVPPTLTGEVGDGLSPIGLIQRAANRWVRQAGQPGVMLVQSALMLDFYAGWTFPRQLYARKVVYRVWGTLPYGDGDYLTAGLLDMLYPGYQNSSYFHDEAGFISPTPYGDTADCVLSDAEDWLLSRYPVVVIAGELKGGAEVRQKLESYVREGGHVVITAGNLARLPNSLGGIQATAEVKNFPPGQVIRVGTSTVAEDGPYDLFQLTFPPHARVLGSSEGVPAVVDITLGKGRVTVFASPFGLPSSPLTRGPVVSKVDTPLPNPYPLLKHVRTILDQVFRSQMLFEVGEGVSLITCRKRVGEYTLGVCNNTWREQPLEIVSHCGLIESIRELPLDQSEKAAVGYLPEGVDEANIGKSGHGTIAGGDIRIFAVQVREENVKEIPHLLPASRPRGRLLPLRGVLPIKEEVLKRPSFFEHYDGVVVDWKYLRTREADILKQEAGWIGRQKLRVFVDLTSGIDVYPDLRLIDDFEWFYSRSIAAIEDVLGKMPVFSAQNLILSLHLIPTDNPPLSEEQAWASFTKTLQLLCDRASAQGVTLHLRMAPEKPPKDLKAAVEFLGKVGRPNLLMAPSTALLLAQNAAPESVSSTLQGKLGLWLVSAPGFDIAGHLWNANAPIAGYDGMDALARMLELASDKPIVLDALYRDTDGEFLDALALEGIVPPPSQSTSSLR